ncbi:hypothetical protein D3C84_728610 [compost metagenome]
MLVHYVKLAEFNHVQLFRFPILVDHQIERVDLELIAEVARCKPWNDRQYHSFARKLMVKCSFGNFTLQPSLLALTSTTVHDQHLGQVTGKHCLTGTRDTFELRVQTTDRNHLRWNGVALLR